MENKIRDSKTNNVNYIGKALETTSVLSLNYSTYCKLKMNWFWWWYWYEKQIECEILYYKNDKWLLMFQFKIAEIFLWDDKGIINLNYYNPFVN